MPSDKTYTFTHNEALRVRDERTARYGRIYLILKVSGKRGQYTVRPSHDHERRVDAQLIEMARRRVALRARKES